MLRYSELKNTRPRFLEVTGVVPDEFEQYLPHFAEAYQELYSFEKTNADPPHPAQNSADLLIHMEDKLLLIWLHHKMQVMPSDLGPQFGLNQSQTDDCIRHLLPVLELTFSKLTMPHLQQHCLKFLQALNTYQVEYLVVGGYAVAFHGYRRPILDFDIFIATHPLNAQKLVRVLQSYGYEVAPQIVEYFQMEERVIRIGMPPFTVEHFAPEDRFIQLGSAPKQLEILTSISAVSFEECYPERVPGVIDGEPVPVIGLAHLKRNKQAGIRLKDADDLAHFA